MAVPKLRFKEFKDEWQKIYLKNTFSFYSTNSLSRADLSKEGIIKNIHYGDIHQQFNNILDVGKEDLPYIKPTIKLNIDSEDNFCQDGDLIFADASEDYEGIGKAIEIINIGSNKVVSGLHTILARDINKIMSIGFKGYLFNTSIIHNQIRVLANGFKVYGISKNNIYDLDIKIPSKAEQEKIVNFLSLLDKKIELQKRKIEALKIYKTGLITKSFNSLNCNEKQIKDIGIVITGTTPSKDNPNYWHNGNITWVTPSDITESKNIYSSKVCLTQLGLSAGRELPKNSLLITCIASIGKNAILKVEGSCNQQINAIIPNDDCDIDFLYYLFEHKKSYMQSIAGTSATSIINKSNFEKILVKIPTIDVQKKISKTLSLIDSKIDLQNCLLRNLISFKKYLLQQMFI